MSTSATSVSLPLTLEERLQHEETLRLSCSWEQFLDAVEQCEYPVQYYRGEIHLDDIYMGIA